MVSKGRPNRCDRLASSGTRSLDFAFSSVGMEQRVDPKKAPASPRLVWRMTADAPMGEYLELVPKSAYDADGRCPRDEASPAPRSSRSDLSHAAAGVDDGGRSRPTVGLWIGPVAARASRRAAYRVDGRVLIGGAIDAARGACREHGAACGPHPGPQSGQGAELARIVLRPADGLHRQGRDRHDSRRDLRRVVPLERRCPNRPPASLRPASSLLRRPRCRRDETSAWSRNP